MKRTTILVDEGLLLGAQRLAARRRITFTVLVQEALHEFLGAHRPDCQLSIMGIVSSGEPYPVDREGDGMKRYCRRQLIPSKDGPLVVQRESNAKEP